MRGGEGSLLHSCRRCAGISAVGLLICQVVIMLVWAVVVIIRVACSAAAWLVMVSW